MIFVTFNTCGCLVNFPNFCSESARAHIN